jgi:hypothetical protein
VLIVLIFLLFTLEQFAVLPRYQDLFLPELTSLIVKVDHSFEQFLLFIKKLVAKLLKTMRYSCNI